MGAEIRARGLRRTPARLAVLAALNGAARPLSAAEVAQRIGLLGTTSATVYRNLVELTDAGLLVRLELGDHLWRFAFRTHRGTRGGPPPHFVCLDCGTIQTLAGARVTLRRQTAGMSTSRPRVTEILLKGHCGCRPESS
jgi:Fur family ferric uptake transcriptional regulator